MIGWRYSTTNWRGYLPNTVHLTGNTLGVGRRLGHDVLQGLSFVDADYAMYE